MKGHPIGRLFAWPLLGLVWFYRNAVSPLIGANCRYQPTCSVYATEALQRYGAFKGGWLAAKRIGRCHPWGGSGYDPLPEEGDVEANQTAGNEAGQRDDEAS